MRSTRPGLDRVGPTAGALQKSFYPPVVRKPKPPWKWKWKTATEVEDIEQRRDRQRLLRIQIAASRQNRKVVVSLAKVSLSDPEKF